MTIPLYGRIVFGVVVAAGLAVMAGYMLSVDVVLVGRRSSGGWLQGYEPTMRGTVKNTFAACLLCVAGMLHFGLLWGFVSRRPLLGGTGCLLALASLVALPVVIILGITGVF